MVENRRQLVSGEIIYYNNNILLKNRENGCRAAGGPTSRGNWRGNTGLWSRESGRMKINDNN